MTDRPPPPLFPLPFALDSSCSRLSRENTKISTEFLKNLTHNSTVPLSFETYPEDTFTSPLIREHHDSYLYYIDSHCLTSTPDEPSFSIPFTSLPNSTSAFRKNIYPSNVYIPLPDVFSTVLKNLSEKNNLLPKHDLTPSAIQALLTTEIYFELPKIEQIRTIENNPHHWLITDILQCNL